jgi:metal-responsive CopG/Arc/MetJ family transcriptional regulator
MTAKRTTQRRVAGVAAALGRRTRKVKTSVSLSEGLLQAVDALAGKSQRSAWIERSVRVAVRRALRLRRDAEELRLLNEHAEAFNRESAEVLAYQAPWDTA